MAVASFRNPSYFFGVKDQVSHPYKYLEVAYLKFKTATLGKGKYIRVRNYYYKGARGRSETFCCNAKINVPLEITV
jgi:hypothetical protein